MVEEEVPVQRRGSEVDWSVRREAIVDAKR